MFTQVILNFVNLQKSFLLLISVWLRKFLLLIIQSVPIHIRTITFLPCNSSILGQLSYSKQQYTIHSYNWWFNPTLASNTHKKWSCKNTTWRDRHALHSTYQQSIPTNAHRFEDQKPTIWKSTIWFEQFCSLPPYKSLLKSTLWISDFMNNGFKKFSHQNLNMNYHKN